MNGDNQNAFDALRQMVRHEAELRLAFEKLMDERDLRYIDKFTSQDEKTTLALTASKEAIIKAETATEKRFDTVNEFRGTLSDQAATLLPRVEASSKFENIDEKIEGVKKEIASLRESRSELGGGVSARDRAWAMAKK
jgi:hypothetical protein